MKSFLNRFIHQLLSLFHRNAACSDAQKKEFLQIAELVKAEIRDWRGTEALEAIGLGQNCNASWYLKETGLKKASYPLDWTFSTPEMIADMVADDFRKFLDKQLLIPHGMDAGHQHYHEWLFGHRNPASSEADHAFLKRCVGRWNEMMQEQRPVVFLVVVLNEFEKRKRWRIGFTKHFKLPKNQTIHDFRPMMEQFTAINPNCRFLFIEQYTEGSFELTSQKLDDRSMWVKFCAIDSNTGVQYLHKVDDEVMKTVVSGLGTAPTE